LRADGRASVSNDSMILRGARMMNSSATYVVGTAMEVAGAGAELGDGLICISGPLVRLATKINLNGASRYPAFGENTPISSQAGISPGSTRYFQVIYRDSNVFCKLQSFNLTNGVAVTFTP
jgi:hypothetical protein